MLPLMFALVYLLLSMRVLVDVRAAVNPSHKGIQIILRAWGVRLCLDMPLRMNMDRKSAGEQLGKAKQVWPFVKAILRAIRWGQTDVNVHVGAQDAALTAMLSGAAVSLGAALGAVAGRRFPCAVHAQTDFRRPGFALHARCIFSFTPGDIMFAVVKEAVKKTQREGFSWLSIPLKA